MPDVSSAVRGPGSPAAATRADARLVRVVAGVLGAERRITAIEASPSPFAGVWPADAVSVEFDGGGTMALWVKRLGAPECGHPDKADPDREPRVYAELLDDRELPVARCHGCRRDLDTGERLLVLEHVQNWDLRYHGLETWQIAVRALARLHARFAARGDALDRVGFLLSVDGEYVRRWAARAAGALARAGAAPPRRLDRLSEAGEAVAEVIGGQPRTLIHNDLAPKNVVADTAAQPARICIVDWETAGVGCAVLDLAHLLYGLEGRDERRLVACYRSEAPGLLPSGAAGARVFAACRAHKALFRLAHPALWSHRPAVARAWLDEVDRAVRAL
jgi:aminoglycoside phosphotransferase (APT) family kinase protein